MTKYQNPFYTFAEATAILKSLGVNPYKNKPAPAPYSGATYPFPWGKTEAEDTAEDIYWQEHVLGINVQREYENGEFYHRVELHLSNEGFEEVMKTLRRNEDEHFETTEEMFSLGYSKISVEPSPLLTLFALKDGDTIA